MLNETQMKAASLIVQRDINGMTLNEIADEVGISVRQLHRWRQEKEFIKFQNDMAETAMESFIAEIYTELRSLMRSSQGMTKLKAIELSLKNRGKLKQESSVSVEVIQKSNEELEQEIEDMLNRTNL